jgi:DNA helicase II / ATP-dependent DNA helicase PcrA
MSESFSNFIEAPFETRTLVLAGPGTGKTESVVRRLEWLVCGDPSLSPASTLVLAFSRTAVQVLVSRLREHREADPDALEELRFLSIRTFDSWTFRMLRMLGRDPRQLLSRSHEANIKDLGDLLQRGGRDLVGSTMSHVKHLIVDECQDLTGSRARLVLELLQVLCPPNEKGRGFTVLGDPDQAIFDWTMGEPDGKSLTALQLIRWIKATYVNELDIPVLERNHRAQSAMLSLVNEASQVLKDKHLTPVARLQAMENLLKDRMKSEVDLPKNGGSVGILCRTNGEALSIAEATRNAGNISVVSLKANSKPSYLPFWIGATLGRFEAVVLTRSLFMRLADQAGYAAPAWDVQRHWQLLLRSCRLPGGATSLEMPKLREALAWPDSLPDDEWAEDDTSTVTTIHQSKGREFERVLVATSTGSKRSDGDPSQEARLIYVGITRARSELEAIAVPGEPLHLWQKRHRGDVHHQRWTRFQNLDTFLEIGIEGDIEPASFISMSALGSKEAIEGVQSMLANRGSLVEGSPIELRMNYVQATKQLFYDVHIYLDGRWIQVGQMSSQLTFDLKQMKGPRRGFPTIITGLFSGPTVTYCTGGDPTPDSVGVWRQSRIWLGIGFHGLGKARMNWKK